MLAAAAFAQGEGEEGCGEGEEDGFFVDGGTEEGEIAIEVDPFEKIAQVEEPNKPTPIVVGQWQPPELKGDAQRELEALLAGRAESPDDAGRRYRLAEFYLKHRWFPQAEAEFLACAKLEPDSIRPWEGLLRVYAEKPEQRDWNELVRMVQARGIVVRDLNDLQEKDWLFSPAERDRRTTRAFEEIVKRRPDDVARRRRFLEHLKAVRDYGRIETEAREILERIPGDAVARFELAEGLRRRSAQLGDKGTGAELYARAFQLLEQNVAEHPDHAPSALRLARMLAARDGRKSEKRIAALEERAFFSLFVREELARIPFRADTVRMARALAGPSLARTLWDSAMRPPARPGEQEPQYVQRWIFAAFPNARPRERERILDRLARRGDREAAGIIVSFLWHMEDFEDWQPPDRDVRERIENLAVDAAARLGAACYPAAERFLLAAEEHRHRRRAVRLIGKLGDARAVKPLLGALAWETSQEFSYGVAGVLERLHDPQAIDALVEAALDVRRPNARRKEAAEALCAFEDPRSVEALSRLYEEQGFDIVAGYGLMRLNGDEKAAAHLAGVLATEYAGEVVRLLEKSRGEATRKLLLVGLERAAPEVRARIIAILKERYWESAKEQVKRVLLEEAKSTDVSEATLALLGEIGGPDVADALDGLVQKLRGRRWAIAARAFAETGDARAVRYFSRTRIVEKDPGRRKLASQLYEVAAARRAERERAETTGG